jgi:C-terminal domain of tail specific protease (DUF3340)
VLVFWLVIVFTSFGLFALEAAVEEAARMSGLFVNPGAKASRNMRLRTIEWRLLRMMRLKTTSRSPLDELRNRSTKRINKDPVFHDLSTEMHLIKQKLRDNRVSLNEKILRKEIAEKVLLQNKAAADRITASGHDRTKYYRLMLADIDRHKLALQQKAELGSAQKHPVPADAAECSDSLTPHTLGQEDFGTATENEAITRETLNILSDLVSLEKTPLMATNTEIP